MGDRVAQSVKHLALAQVTISRFVIWSPSWGGLELMNCEIMT